MKRTTVLLFLTFLSEGFCDVMVSTNETLLLEIRSTVKLPCEFLMHNFSMFENPIIWNKRQVITEEQIQINIMGNILEPFLSTHRFQVTLENEDPRFRMTLKMTDFSAEDVGNYSCEVRGRRSVVLGKVHHAVSIKVPAIEIILEIGNNSGVKAPLIGDIIHDYMAIQEQRVLLFVENQFQAITCTCRSFNPNQSVRISLGSIDVSNSFDEMRLTHFTGVKGLHVVQYTIVRTSFNLTFVAIDDDRPITCSASSPGLPVNKTERLINVIHQPYFKCPESTAYQGETNVFLRCLVRARPPVTSLYWDFHSNDTSSINKANYKNNDDKNFSPDVDDYWSTVTDTNNGWMETKFFIRHVTNQSFKNYKVTSENQIGINSMLVSLKQVNKPLPYESRLQSDNPAWNPKSSLEYVVIRSAPNQPSSSYPTHQLHPLIFVVFILLSTHASPIHLLLNFMWNLLYSFSNLRFFFSFCPGQP